MNPSRFYGSVGALALLAIAPPLAGCATDAPAASAAARAPEGQIVAMRRLTGVQYRQIIADVFGPEVKVQGRFEPEARREGLIAVGSGSASISAAGMEQYFAMAGRIADQAMAPERRAAIATCEPASLQGPDDACAAAFFRDYGRRLFRRPLSDAEVAKRVSLANRVAAERQDYYAGLREGVVSLLTAPDFLFRIERSDPARSKGKELVLDPYARASRLSFLFWNTGPDEELLKAADSGALMTPEGLKTQVDRLSASPRAADGVRAFFDDMLQLELFEHQSKDPAKFPKYSQLLAVAAREQTLKTVLELVLTRNGDYRDIFTSRDTFMTRQLAMVYKVPYTSRAEWAPYTFDETEGRSGVLTQISFLSLFSHPARSSPTKRGVALNEVFLCEVTPSPPGNVDFSLVNESEGSPLKTVRLRLEAHANDETCASCHTMVDPPGLALERFDSLGEYRERENGEKIDVSAEMDGVKFEGAPGLGMLLRDNPRVPACLVRNLYQTAIGRPTEQAEKPLLQSLTKTFADGGYRVPAFMKTLAMSEALYRAAPEPKTKPARGTRVAQSRTASAGGQ